MSEVYEAGITVLRLLKAAQAELLERFGDEMTTWGSVEKAIIQYNARQGLYSAIIDALRNKVDLGEITGKERDELVKKLDEEYSKPLKDYL